MKIKGVVFDFNGTLFWDTHINNQSWYSFLMRHGIMVDFEEMVDRIHGRNNQESILHYFGDSLTEQELRALSVEKESVYQEKCMELKPQLAPGARSFFQFLKDQNIPFTIASASIKENIDFYFEYHKLDQYFDKSKVVYNDYVIKSKPHPEYYENAMKILGISKEETLVFEDSFAGISSAENAGAAQIIIVNSNNDDYSDYNHPIIKSFDEVDRNLFY